MGDFVLAPENNPDAVAMLLSQDQSGFSEKYPSSPSFVARLSFQQISRLAMEF